jgi:membrane-associated phospholipid phosphatase
LLAAVLIASASRSARADELFRYDLRVELPLLAAGGLGWVTTELLESRLAPSHCRWCDRNADGSDGLDGFDAAARRAFRLAHPGPADTASSLLAFGLAPALALGLDVAAAGQKHELRRVFVDVLIIVEAAVLAADVDQLVKFTVGRERPAEHAQSLMGLPTTSRDGNASFFSGHTTLVFSLATASGMVATLRRDRLAPLVWALGLSVATVTGYLRIAADRHYLSDVLVGALVGSASGMVVPFAHWRRAPRLPSLSLSATRTEARAGLAWRW